MLNPHTLVMILQLTEIMRQNVRAAVSVSVSANKSYVNDLKVMSRTILKALADGQPLVFADLVVRRRGVRPMDEIRARIAEVFWIISCKRISPLGAQ